MPIVIYEYAACLVAAVIAGTVLFTIGAMCVLLWSVGGLAWQWWRDLAAVPNWLARRSTSERLIT